MTAESIPRIIQTIEALSLGDTVTFEDSEQTKYTGEVVEIQKKIPDEYRGYVIRERETQKERILKVLYDSEGGPVKVTENNSSKKITSIQVED